MTWRRAARGAAFLCVAALAACSAPPAPASTRTIEIAMRYSRFDPRAVTVRAGTTVTFLLRNDDPIAHEFILGSEDEQRAHEHGEPIDHDGRPGEATLGPGERDTVTYTFERPGRMIFGCHRPGHYAYGMRGIVTVER